MGVLIEVVFHLECLSSPCFASKPVIGGNFVVSHRLSFNVTCRQFCYIYIVSYFYQLYFEMDQDRRNGLVTMLTRSPFPSVNTLILLTFVTASVVIASVVQTFKSQPELSRLLEEEMLNSTSPYFDGIQDGVLKLLCTSKLLQGGYYFLNTQPYVWVAIATYFAFLALTAKIMISLFCKELSRQEEAMVRHDFFSFFLFSIVFLSVVAGVSQGVYVLPWLLWFGFHGFMTVLHQVTYQRFKFMAPSSGVTGGKLSWLCFFLFVISTVVFLTLLRCNHMFSFNHFLFLLVDGVVSLARSTHGLLRCLSASDGFRASPDTVRHFNYYLDLFISIFIDGIQLINFAHLMLYSPIGFNLTCIFFFYHIKLAYSSLVTLLNRHWKHNQIFQHIVNTYPMEKAPEGDLCIVCWESLGDSRKLPCAHYFHDWCLMWWLAQDASCPTCRRPVSAPQPAVTPVNVDRTTTFRFGGGGIFRLPSFVIEFNSGGAGILGPLLRRQELQVDDSQLMGWGHQVHEMFPQLSMENIIADLRVSGGVQATIENIIEGRVGFVGLLGADETLSDEESWHGDEEPDLGNLAEEDNEEPRSINDYSPNTDEHSDFARRKKEMILHYRRRYIESERGRDLRERGVQC